MNREMREKMKNSFSKQRHNPIELMKKYWPNAGISHIEIGLELKYNVRITCAVNGAGIIPGAYRRQVYWVL